MTKTELIRKVSMDTHQTAEATEKIINGMLDTIRAELVKGNSVQITGFGTFKVGARTMRKGRNPRTGEEIIIPARKVPQFTAGKTLKEALK